jgi:hypothetical protein
MSTVQCGATEKDTEEQNQGEARRV